MDPDSWLDAVIDEFRTRAEDLSEDAQDRLGSYDLSPPTQITDYWIEPLDLHYIVVTHFEDEPDRRIKVVGPMDTHILAQKLEENANDPFWDKDAEWHLDLPDPEEAFLGMFEPKDSFREHLRERLAHLYSNVHNMMFSHHYPRDPGPGSMERGPGDSMHLSLWGPLADLDAQEYVDREFGHAIRRAHDPPEPPAPSGRDTSTRSRTTRSKPNQEDQPDGYWTYLYPSARIGEPPERSIAAMASGYDPDPYNRPAEEFADTPDGLLYSHDGFIGVHLPDRHLATRRLNLTAFALGELGAFFHAVHTQDIGSFEEFEKGDKYRRFQSMRSPQSARKVAVRRGSRNVFSGAHIPTEQVDVEDLHRAYRMARAIEGSGWSEDVTLLLQARTLAEETLHSPSVLMGWAVIEREINRRFREHVLQTEVHAPADADELSSYWKINLLSDLAENSLTHPEKLHKLREARNDTAHGGAKADPETSELMIKHARRLLEPRLADALTSG